MILQCYNSFFIYLLKYHNKKSCSYLLSGYPVVLCLWVFKIINWFTSVFWLFMISLRTRELKLIWYILIFWRFLPLSFIFILPHLWLTLQVDSKVFDINLVIFASFLVIYVTRISKIILYSSCSRPGI